MWHADTGAGQVCVMEPTPAAKPTRPSELVRISDRVSFLYVERCTVHRDSNAITITDERGVVHVPAAGIGSLLLGPGTRVTHQAMVLMAESGAATVWVGERGVRYYAHGRPLGRTSRLLEAQAKLVSNRDSRLAVARAMYSLRFPNEDTTGLTMQQLRGREGARVRRTYREHAERTGVGWRRRDYDPEDFRASDSINQALSAATTCLYGVAHAVIAALGCAPGLGFIHTGHDRSFVFDIADLYKADVAIPIAFDAAAQEPDDVSTLTRRLIRDRIYDRRLIPECARDVNRLLLGEDTDAENDATYADIVQLWDDREGVVASGQSWHDPVETPW